MPHSDFFQTESRQHSDISPAILYWGTPVVLISSLNEDGSANIMPMSSAFWLGHGCMLGMGATSQTAQNLQRTKQCVLGLASDQMTGAVNALARTTGSDPVPAAKQGRGYRHVKDKFACAGLTPMESQHVDPPGIQECPVLMEAMVIGVHPMFGGQPFQGSALAIEVKIVRISIHDELRLDGYKNRIDADRWRPMIMMFCELYGLKPRKLEQSKLAEIDEESYRPITGTKG